jgi:hypothetical protein
MPTRSASTCVGTPDLRERREEEEGDDDCLRDAPRGRVDRQLPRHAVHPAPDQLADDDPCDGDHDRREQLRDEKQRLVEGDIHPASPSSEIAATTTTRLSTRPAIRARRRETGG